MEPQNAKKDENEKALEASVGDNDKVAGKNGEVAGEAKEKDENDVLGTSAEEKSKADDKSVGTFVDTNQDLAALKVPVEENNAENVTDGATSSGMKKPHGLPAKTKVVKTVKKILKRKVKRGTAVQVAGEVNGTAEQGIKEGGAVVNIKEAEQIPKPSLGKSEKEVQKVIESVADSPRRSSGKCKDLETSLGERDMELTKELVEAPQPANGEGNVVGGAPSGKEIVNEVKGKANIRKRQKGKKVKGTLTQRMGTESINISQGRKEGVDLDSVVSDRRDAETSLGGNMMEAKAIEDKPGLAEDKRSKKKRKRKQVLASNKKLKKDAVAAAGATQQKVEENKDQLVDTEKKETDGPAKVTIGGLIFMCNSKTRPDCFRFRVMGVQEKRKDYVMGIKPGLKLFLYDYDLKLLYGIFQASSRGGMKLERNAFGGSFSAQVRFKVVSDCLPLPESQFKKAIKENYDSKNKFKTELTHKQVFKLKKLFRPVPATIPAQLTHNQPIPISFNAERKRSDTDCYTPSSSRTHPTHTHERRRVSPPPPRREEKPHDLYLSEREYQTYGLRREVPTQHYSNPPPDYHYQIINRDRIHLDPHRLSVDHHNRLLRQAEIERLDRREVHLLHLPERDYHSPYEHPTSGREILARNSHDIPPSALALDSYRRDPYYSYEYRAPERPPRTYQTSLRREEDDLYSRYITADSLAEYYRSSQRYPESELVPSSVSSRYAYSGSLHYPPHL